MSYNRIDRDWAEWIAWVIEGCGYRAVIQAWDFAPGSVWPAEMQKAVTECDATVCVLSPDFLKSNFTAAEWQVAFSDDPVGAKRKLIPVRVRECEPDGFLKTRVYIDIVGRGREDARDTLRRALSGDCWRSRETAEIWTVLVTTFWSLLCVLVSSVRKDTGCGRCGKPHPVRFSIPSTPSSALVWGTGDRVGWAS